MVHTYEEALAWIHGRLKFGIKPGLKRMQWMMEKLDHPERRLKAVHVGGTNGKGSTVEMIRSIIQEAGYHVGTFTSPYIEQFNERISVNGKPISNEEIVKLTNVIKPLAEELEQTEMGGPSEFEVITAMAIYYFAKIRPVPLVIFEVGMGGRLDSTNVIIPILTVITNIGMDHMEFLGDTVEKIAFEKAGIIKNGVPVITAVQQDEALAVIQNRCKKGRSSLYQFGKEFTAEHVASVSKGEKINFSSVLGNWDNVVVGLKGVHQVTNSALAIMAASYLKTFFSFLIEEEHLRDGLKNAFWPGRMEVLSDQPFVMVDGAHNPDGIRALTETMKMRYSDYKLTILFAALKTKKIDEMVQSLEKIADELVFTTFDFPKAAGQEEFAGFNGTYIGDEWPSFLKEKIASLQKNEMLLITGSLYFISEVKKAFKK
jgi:dihydrofolate synthase/folylpolyglutamate synthase